MTYLKSYMCSHSITKCRAFYKIFSKSIGILFIFFSFSALSATQNQIELIQKTAEEYIVSNVEWPTNGTLEARASNIDSRISATDCLSGLTASSSSTNPTSSNITVLIECPSDNWRVYVPVRLTRTGPQVTITTPISRGQIITKQNVTVSMVDLQRYRRQGFSEINQVVGAKSKKNLRAGDVVEAGDVCVVCRNETVVIRAANEGMTITTKGVALSDGGFGEHIRVKNSKSNRIIEGTVTAIGEVTVRF